ncbi:hypothetical protein PAERUG_P24_London_17_VIM_2_08_10_04547 [Pseudomonas aeruginosa]|nr:hypothetical protein PAERUG_P24_London_17_VIM_2_08_10_04547 [Pseudomonas aeruginosa]
METAGQLLENSRHRGQGGFVGDQQDVADASRRFPFVAAGVIAVLPVGRGQLQAVADPRVGRPGRGRAVLAVEDELHVDLLLLGAQRTDGVGTHRRPASRLDAAIGLVPLAATGQAGRLAAGIGEEDLDPLVGGQGLHLGDLRAAEDEAGQRRAELLAALEFDIEQTIGGLRHDDGLLVTGAQRRRRMHASGNSSKQCE